jgi:hypothetical protein
VLTERGQSEPDSATEEASQHAIDVKFNFFDMSRSAIAGQFLHSALEFRPAVTTISASKLEAQLQAAPVTEFPENQHIFEQSAYQVADRVLRQGPRGLQIKY